MAEQHHDDPFIHYQPPHEVNNEGIRPVSDAWLRNPAWMDGGVDPFQIYRSEEEMQATIRAHWSRALALHEEDRFKALEAGREVPQLPEIIAKLLQPQPPRRDQTPVLATEARAIARRETEVRNDAVDVAEPTGDQDTNTDNGAHDMYTINVVLHKAVLEKVTTRGGQKLVEKVKPFSENIRSEFTAEWSRYDFFQKVIYRAHGLVGQFGIGNPCGPRTKAWHTGFTKGTSFNIANDESYEAFKESVLNKRGVCNIYVDLEASELQGFRVHPDSVLGQLRAAVDGAGVELMNGTHVPHVAAYSATDQANGAIILDLQKRWGGCPQHKSESGQAAVCYREGGTHVPLNMRRLCIWSDAIAADKATKEQPPDMPEFGGQPEPKPRGRTGPRPAPDATPFTSTSATDMSGVAPLLMTVVAKQAMDMITASSSRRRYSVSPHRRRSASPHSSSAPSSPIPADDGDLHEFLAALLAKKGIDFLASEEALAAEEYSPSVLAAVPVQELCELTRAPKGRVMKLQQFAVSWSAKRERKMGRRHRG